MFQVNTNILFQANKINNNKLIWTYLLPKTNIIKYKIRRLLRLVFFKVLITVILYCYTLPLDMVIETKKKKTAIYLILLYIIFIRTLFVLSDTDIIRILSILILRKIHSSL